MKEVYSVVISGTASIQKLLKGLTSCIVASVLFCTYYNPVKYEGTSVPADTSVVSGAAGVVYNINTGQQICNSSISQDTVNFPGAMLWLGFTQLSVSKAPAGYSVKSVQQHDRLTISNFKNEVVWFLMKDSVAGVDCEFQDPEWSAHPHYLATLGQHYNKDGFCEDGEYSLYAVRTVPNKEVLKLNKRKMNNLATPHFWVDRSVTSTEGGTPDSTSVTYDENGFITLEPLKTFFGTEKVKIAWSKKEDGLTIYWADYSSGGTVVNRLSKPAGREGWKAESPLFSPDGNFIVYNLYQTQTNYECWVQELRKGAMPKLVSDAGMDPRWWIDPWENKLYITYVKRNGLIYTILEKLDDPSLTDGSAGGTFKRAFNPAPGVPQALRNIGPEELIVKLPFKGGLSPDGRYMCTGTNYAYMLGLEEEGKK